MRAALAKKDAIEAAIARLPVIGEEEKRLAAALETARARHREREERLKALAVARARAEGLRRQAGDAALRAEGLRKRFGLTEEVSCRGTDLQPRCQLLADAHEARALTPSADGEMARLREAFDAVNAEIPALETGIESLGNTEAALRAAQEALTRVMAERREAELLAALAEGLKQAEQRLAECAAADHEVSGAHSSLLRCRKRAS